MFNGSSKAKKLRAFWGIESDASVGKSLSGMLDIVRYNKQRSGKTEADGTYDECRKIANRLLGKHQVEEASEQQFPGPAPRKQCHL